MMGVVTMSEIVAAILYVAVGSILMGVVTRRGIDRGGELHYGRAAAGILLWPALWLVGVFVAVGMAISKTIEDARDD